MNIKIPKELSEELLKITLNTVEFGNTKGEDKDLLHIVKPNFQMDYSAVDNNHTLFYKDEDNKTDHLFITPRGFINGLVTGSNTLFFEVLYDGLLEGTCISFLEDYTDQFITYKLLKALIGCAERDYKQAKNHKNPEKKIKWALEYANIVLKSLGGDALKEPCLSKDYIRYIRDRLNQTYQEGGVLFSVPSEVFIEIMTKENYIEFYQGCFGGDTIPISKLYYDNWSEDK